MKKLIISAAIIATAALSGCANNASKPTAYSDLVSEAKALQADAAKSGYVWQQKKMKKPYVEHYIDQAEQAKAAGDEAAALKAANQAYDTAVAQIAQREDNADLKGAWEK